MRNDVIGLGYCRKDGRMGIRNRALVVYLSGCAEFVAKSVANAFSPDLVEVVGCPGCRDNPDMNLKLTALALHPNVGAVLAVGNGCEAFTAKMLESRATASEKPAASVEIRDVGGVSRAVAEGKRVLAELLLSMDKVKTAPFRMSDLVIGAECGGSDFTSGLSANPLVGRLFDRLADLGATVIFEEMYECVGLRDQLAARCASPEACERMKAAYDRYFRHSEDDKQFYISPGNVKGGLTTIEEKSMGAVAKSGTRPIQGLIRPGERPVRPGLWMMDGMGDSEDDCGFSVSNDASSTLLMISCGAHMTILTSGRGHLINNPIGPIFKITGNPRTYQNLSDDMDFNASPLLDGRATPEEMTDELFSRIAAVAAGEKTLGEALGHREAVMYYEKIERKCPHAL